MDQIQSLIQLSESCSQSLDFGCFLAPLQEEGVNLGFWADRDGKTHTDAKGKLCLESVNFTLSIFNTETRRNNPRAWRSLGFINDLSTKYGSGILEVPVPYGDCNDSIGYDVSFFY